MPSVFAVIAVSGQAIGDVHLALDDALGSSASATARQRRQQADGLTQWRKRFQVPGFASR